jgi:hypothetical protein
MLEGIREEDFTASTVQDFDEKAAVETQTFVAAAREDLYGQCSVASRRAKLTRAVFAVVVPDTAVKAAERLPARVRERLWIQKYGVARRRRASRGSA